MAERLAGGNIALALLANTLATAGALVALILTFGPISGRAFQPGGDARFCGAQGAAVGGGAGLSAGATCRGRAWRLAGARHVRSAILQASAHAREGIWTMGGRVHRDLRAARRHLELHAASSACDALRCRLHHHGRLLVHLIHLFRQPGGDRCACALRHFRRHPGRRTRRLFVIVHATRRSAGSLHAFARSAAPLPATSCSPACPNSPSRAASTEVTAWSFAPDFCIKKAHGIRVSGFNAKVLISAPNNPVCRQRLFGQAINDVGAGDPRPLPERPQLPIC